MASHVSLPAVASPFDLVADAPDLRVAAKGTLLRLSRELEDRAHALGAAGMLLASFEHVRHFTPATRRRYSELAAQGGHVGAFGEGFGPDPAPGVHGAALREDDPLARQWDVVLLGPDVAGALLAYDLGDTGADMERRFRYAVTWDRELVRSAVRSLLDRRA
ncbi:DICT sensory domain-containing protein [Conexibacter sp. SYSU D00693]|uniref:DICT sensory domain-containing protein n=1 Tax=Conexibacter sp. SYSU D00693 TaxID=2812560 RepID=UPI00196B0E58|nr:DICT sensory domain-containing protein [Conexibacter sp. SYSU D00693]